MLDFHYSFRSMSTAEVIRLYHSIAKTVATSNSTMKRTSRRNKSYRKKALVKLKEEFETQRQRQRDRERIHTRTDTDTHTGTRTYARTWGKNGKVKSQTQKSLSEWFSCFGIDVIDHLWRFDPTRVCDFAFFDHSVNLHKPSSILHFIPKTCEIRVEGKVGNSDR
jgi:hypothetical protein